MYSFFVNGCQVSKSKKQSLLRFLRDEMHLTSVKDGCSQGACGACTVLIDGETCKACVLQTDRLEGRSIITVDGLSKWESEVYTYAYGEAGAVQCGFCIPGMIMCTKGLLDRNPDPTEEEIKYALRNNYCRCTGYVKIIAAVKLAAKIMRAGKIPAAGADDWLLGSRVHRLDVEEKVLGYGKYPDDYYLDGMCYGTALRSKYPRARVLSIDTTAAKALPGVIDVFTAADIPGENKIGHLKHDQYTIIWEMPLHLWRRRIWRRQRRQRSSLRLNMRYCRLYIIFRKRLRKVHLLYLMKRQPMFRLINMSAEAMQMKPSVRRRM